MSNFSQFLRDKRAKNTTAGYNDSVIAPELVSDQPRATSIFENLQYISKDEVDMIRDLTGIQDSVVFDENDDPYINPIHLEPEIEAVLNKNRSDRIIPNNGPFYADTNSKQVFASDLEKENHLLRVGLSKALARNQVLLAERANLMRQVNAQKMQEALRVKSAQVKNLVSLMQKKGMLANSEEAAERKTFELSAMSNEAFVALKDVVIETKTIRSASTGNPKLANNNFNQFSPFNTQVVNTPHMRDNGNIIDKFKNLPWSHK